MTSPIRPNPIRMTDDRGKPIVKLALNRRGTQHAIMDAADYDALPLGMRHNLLLNDDGKGRAYVKVSCPNASGGLVMVSRVITGASKGIEVRHLNGNRRDLRRTNLEQRPNRVAKRNHLEEIPVEAIQQTVVVFTR